MIENKIFILGWSGYIGTALISRLRSCGQAVTLIGRKDKSHIQFDLHNPDYGFISDLKSGDKFVFLSAISSPEYCADNYTLSYRVNVTNTIALIKMLLDKGVEVLFASSDVVYGRTDKPVNEMSLINPQFAYAEMKSLVEDEFKGFKGFKVMRLSYVWSLGDKFTSFLLKSYDEKSKVDVFHPFIRSIITLRDVIDFIERFLLVIQEFPKVVNLAGPEFLSRVQLVEAFSEIKAIEYAVVKPDHDFFMYRPDQILMESIYLDKVLNRNPFSVIDTIKTELLAN